MNIIDNYDSIMLYDDTIMHIDEVDTYISGDFSEEKLAELLSVITYKSSDLYEIEDDDWALQYAERWWELEERIYELIKNILNEQNNHGANYTIEGIGLYNMAVPFMERNGYRDGNGWWVKE